MSPSGERCVHEPPGAKTYRRGHRDRGEENGFNKLSEIWFLGACPGPKSGHLCGEAFSMKWKFHEI